MLSGKSLQSNPATGGTRPVAEILRLLSQPASETRWRRQFGLLRESLTAADTIPTATPEIIPGLLALAQLQPEHRREYLAFLEICHDLPRLAPASDPGLLVQVRAEVAAGEERFRDFLERDPAPEVRAAAARLLGRLPMPSSESRQALSWALAFDRSPQVCGEALAALHPLEARESRHWAGRLESFLTEANPPTIRFRAACLRLTCRQAPTTETFAQAVSAMAATLYAERANHDFPAQAITLARLATGRLDRARAVELWCALLAASREFDGAIEISLQLLRAAFADEREGWEDISLSVRHRSGGPADEPNLFAAITRLAWAGVHYRMTGQFPTTKLRKHHRPARDYVGIRAFPPGLNLTDPCQARAVSTIAGTAAPWLGFTNLWTLFGLPSRRLEMQLLLNEERV